MGKIFSPHHWNFSDSNGTAGFWPCLAKNNYAFKNLNILSSFGVHFFNFWEPLLPFLGRRYEVSVIKFSIVIESEAHDPMV